MHYTHGNKFGNTLALGEGLKESVFFFSGNNGIFITYVSYIGLATCQFMGIHNILSLCYGACNMPYLKNSTFTKYEFAFLLLHSANLNFLNRNRNKMLIVESDRFQ